MYDIALCISHMVLHESTYSVTQQLSSQLDSGKPIAQNILWSAAAAAALGLFADFAPRLTKTVIASCRSNLNVLPTSSNGKCNTYRPGQCYCDKYCTKAADCCRDCPQECPAGASRKDAAFLETLAAAAASGSANQPAVTAAEAAVASIAAQHRKLRLAADPAVGSHDCGSNKVKWDAVSAAATAAGVATASAESAVWTAASGQQIVGINGVHSWLLKCQAADKGPPVQPYRLPVNWVRAVHCTDAAKTNCTGNEYGVNNVWDQINMLNDKFARTGIQFDWNGKIQVLHVTDPIMDFSSCWANEGCIECKATRAGDTALNVMTTPTFVDGVAQGEWKQAPCMRQQQLPDAYVVLQCYLTR
jgi:hypothetical protein